MFAALRPLQSADQNAAFLPLNIRPAQIAEFGNAQAVVEREPDGSGIARSVAVSPCRLAQRQDFITAQVFTRSAFLIRDPRRPEPICSIFSICSQLTEGRNGQGLPRLLRRDCSITAQRWNTHSTRPAGHRGSSSLASHIRIVEPICDLLGLPFRNIIRPKHTGIPVRVPCAPPILCARWPEDVTILHYRDVARTGKPG